MRPLLLTLIAAVAAGVFWIAATTYPAPTDAVSIPDNQLRTGAIALDLTGGAASADLSLPGLLPGGVRVQRFWLATSRTSSATAGVLTLRFDRMKDLAGPCAVSRDKALAEQASGIDGCDISGEQVSGRPAQGNLSRLLRFRLRSTADDRVGDCEAGAGDVVAGGGPGTLRSLVGRDIAVQPSPSAGARTLRPGRGVCVSVEVDWPARATGPADRDHPLDNAAQGDSLTVRAVFTLRQAIP